MKGLRCTQPPAVTPKFQIVRRYPGIRSKGDTCFKGNSREKRALFHLVLGNATRFVSGVALFSMKKSGTIRSFGLNDVVLDGDALTLFKDGKADRDSCYFK